MAARYLDPEIEALIQEPKPLPEGWQARRPREDAYAEPTDRYERLEEAFLCLVKDGNLEAPPDPQGSLFGEGLDL